MHKTTLLALAAASLLAALPAHAATADLRAERAEERQRQDLYKAWFPDLATARKAAISLHGYLLESEYERGWQIFQLDAEQIALLQRFGYRIEPATEFMQRRDAFLTAIDALKSTQRSAKAAASSGSPGIESIPNYACYETVEETFAAAQAMATARPDLASWTDVGDSWQKTANSGGYDMRVLKLSNSAVVPASGSKPKLFITSAIHAREYVTAPVALAFAKWLFDGYGSNADATWLLDHHEIHLMLQTNPDGRKKAEGGLSWRKNTNTAYCSATSNNRGADLNRNFTFEWNSTNGQGSSGSQCNETYRGPSAGSEPEVKAVEAYIRGLWPDSRGPAVGDAAPATTSGIHLDLHSYSQLVLWPWGATNAVAPNGVAMQTLGRRFAFFNNYSPMQSVGLYPTDGTSDGPSYGELGVAALTFEMGTSFFQSCTDYTNTIKPANLQALIYAAKVVRTPYLTPAGPDVTALTLGASSVVAGTPVALSATLTDTRFNQSNGTEPVLAIASAEAYIDTPPWLPGATPISLTATDGAFNSSTESAAATLSTANLAAGRHTVFVRGSVSSGQAGPFTAAFLDVTAPPITLGATAVNVRGQEWTVNLAWSGLSSTSTDIYVNGAVKRSVPNTGGYSDRQFRGIWRYKVCQTGSTTACSAEVSVQVSNL